MTARRRFAPPALLLLGIAVAIAPAAQPPKPADPKAPAADGRLADAIPPDAVAFVSVDVAKVWEHKTFAPVREARGKLEFAWAVQSLVGLAPAEIDRVTVFWHRSPTDGPFVLVTGRKPVDPAAVVRTLTRQVPAPKVEPKPGPSEPARTGKVLVAPGAEFPNVVGIGPRTVLLAPDPHGPADLDRLTARPGRPDGGPLGVVLADAGGSAVTVALTGEAVGQWLGDAAPAGVRQATSAVLTADVTAEVKAKVSLTLSYPDAATASGQGAPALEQMLKALAKRVAEEEKRSAEKGQTGTGYPAPLLEWAGAALKAAKVRVDGRTVAASAEVDLNEGVSRLMFAVPDAALAPRGPSAAENNLKQILLALHNYHDVHGHCPGNVYAKDGTPLLSWRVQILPYIEQAALYQQFKQDEPWDSPANKPLSQTAIKVFQVPGRPAGQPWETYFQTFIGPKEVKPEYRPWLVEGNPKGPQLAQITDGTSNTLAVVEAADAVPWAKPADLPYDGVSPLPKLGGLNGVHVAAFGDGSVRTFRRGQIDDTNLRRLISLSDGQVVNIPNR